MSKTTDSDISKEMAEISSPKLNELLEAKKELGSLTQMAIDVGKNLTPKQRAFLDKYATYKDVAKALTEAKLGTQTTSVHRYKTLLQTPEARLYLKQIEDLGFVEAVLSIEEIIEKARRVFDNAMQDGDYKACNEVIKFLGQYKGMTVDRKESTTVNINTNHTSGDKPSEVKSDINRFKDIINKATTPSATLVKLKNHARKNPV